MAPDLPDQPRSVRSKSKMVPANSRLRWTQTELDIISRGLEKTREQAYQLYLKECEEKGLAVRAFLSFVKKRQSFLKDMKKK